jgi:hypothetical protein
MTDLGVYLRAAWAVRTGVDPYAITDTNGFHYVYPPLFAILMMPMADAPAGVAGGSLVPFPVSAALWYAFSVGCLLWAVHYLAGVLEALSCDPRVRRQPRGCWRWWTLRTMPVIVCLPCVLGTLVHGQVNLLLLALLCSMIGAHLQKRPWQAGFCLSGAICLKVFPAFLLLYVTWRRDFRCLCACGIGLVLGLAVVPTAVWGPQRALWYHQRFAAVVLLPGIGIQSDQSRAKELTEVTATDSQSLLAVIHNTAHLNRYYRPVQASPLVRIAALLLAGVFGAATMVVGRRPCSLTPACELLIFGQLVVVMLLLCPVCHLSYFCLTLPLVMGVVEVLWIPSRAPAKGALAAACPLRVKAGVRNERTGALMLLFGLMVSAHTLPHVPGLEIQRDLGLAMYAAILMWILGWDVVRQLSRLVQSVTGDVMLARAA